jgi:hypothetical protein
MSATRSVGRAVLGGAAAGAAGTTALNAATYLDMTVRGRGASSTPEQSVAALADKADIDIPGEGDTRENRISGLGPMLGIATGVGVGAVVGLLRRLGLRTPYPVTTVLTAGAAMIGANAPMAQLGISDPKSWSSADWAADAGPHVAYGLVTAGVLHGLDLD